MRGEGTNDPGYSQSRWSATVRIAVTRRVTKDRSLAAPRLCFGLLSGDASSGLLLAREDAYCTASTVLHGTAPRLEPFGPFDSVGAWTVRPSTKRGRCRSAIGNALQGIPEGCWGPPAQEIRYEQPMLLPQLWHK